MFKLFANHVLNSNFLMHQATTWLVRAKAKA